MKYENLYDANEILESVIEDVAVVANIEDAEVLAQLRRLIAQGAVRVAELEAEYNEDSAPFGVADDLAQYLN